MVYRSMKRELYMGCEMGGMKRVAERLAAFFYSLGHVSPDKTERMLQGGNDYAAQRDDVHPGQAKSPGKKKQIQLLTLVLISCVLNYKVIQSLIVVDAAWPLTRG